MKPIPHEPPGTPQQIAAGGIEGEVDRVDALQASSSAVDDLMSAEVAGDFEAVRRGDADHVGTQPARKLGRELPHAPSGAGDEGRCPSSSRP